jgi:hypothetical protein
MSYNPGEARLFLQSKVRVGSYWGTRLRYRNLPRYCASGCMLLKMRAKAIALIGIGGAWFLVVAWGLAARGVVFRELVLAGLRVIDRLPLRIVPATLVVFWYALLFGWFIPVIVGLRLLRRRK